MSGRHFFDYAAGAVQLLLCNARKRSYCLETISSDFCYCVVRVDGAERFLFYVPLLPCYGTGLYLWLLVGIMFVLFQGNCLSDLQSDWHSLFFHVSCRI